METNQKITAAAVVFIAAIVAVFYVFARNERVQLFYYDASRDRDASGNILCSRAGLVAVNRAVPRKNAIENTIQLLLKGELTAEERERGIATEFPLDGFALEEAVLKQGTLMLRFKDSFGKTSGGACRAGILWFQIEATALRFPGVERVRFLPEELFQP